MVLLMHLLIPAPGAAVPVLQFQTSPFQSERQSVCARALSAKTSRTGAKLLQESRSFRPTQFQLLARLQQSNRQVLSDRLAVLRCRHSPAANRRFAYAARHPRAWPNLPAIA